MAINVQVRCSDCGEVVERTLNQNDTEIICPECQRNMPSLSKEEYRSIEKTQGSQKLLGILSIAFAIGVAVMLFLYIGDPKSWISGAKSAVADSMFLYGAAACLLVSAILGFLSARREYVVEI